MELLAVAFVALSLAGIIVRARWEKRNGVEESRDEAVGGWFGGTK